MDSWFLSEFGNSRRTWFHNYFGWIVAVTISTGAAVTILAGHIAGSSAVRLTLTKIEGASTETSIGSLEYGYLLELNHGLLFLIVAPVIVLLGHRFFCSAARALSSLAIQGRVAGGHELLRQLDRLNKRFIWVWIVGLVYFGLFAYKDWHKRYEAKNPLVYEIGFLQTPYLGEYVEWFNKQRTVIQRENLRKTALGEVLRDAIDERKKVAKGGKATYRLKIDGQRNEGAFVLEKGGVAPSYAHDTFTLLYSVLERSTHVVFVWILAKVVFWFWLLWHLHPRTPKIGDKIRLSAQRMAIEFRDNASSRMNFSFDDPGGYYGVRDLHASYNSVVAIVLVGCAAVAMHFVSNWDKGTFELPKLLAVLFLVFPIALALSIGPIAMFARRLGIHRDHIKAALDQEIKRSAESVNHSDNSVCVYEIVDGAAASHPPKLQLENPDSIPFSEKSLLARRNLLDEQAAWPRRSKSFRNYLFLALIFGAIPLFASSAEALNTVSKEFEKAINILAFLKSLLVAIADSYKLF